MSGSDTDRKRGANPFRKPPAGSARIVFFSIVCILLNVILGWSLLYAVRKNTGISWIPLNAETYRLVLEVVLRGLYILGPLILSYVLNNALLHLFFHDVRAPKGIGLFTLLLVLSVQTASVCGMIKLTDGSILDQETVTATVQLESFPED